MLVGSGKAAKKSWKVKLPKKDKAKKRRRKESYAIYIYKVLRQVHLDIGISSQHLHVLNFGQNLQNGNAFQLKLY
uniref:Uncharacterized protein n=1 Tax=Echinococcus canadensis TaxID=519352 RepID=A0A915EVH7_9CEST